MNNLQSLRKEIKKLANPERAKLLQRYFKTEKGEYGEGDIFVGLTVPQCRKLAKKYKDLEMVQIEKLLCSKIHEERLIAVLLLIHFFKTSTPKGQERIYHFYLSHTPYINNWDLVDLSAPTIVGQYSLTRSQDILDQLAQSDIVWEKRIAILATFAFIKNGDAKPSFRIAEKLLNDKHDLIHKAVGWMLREVGKRVSQDEEEKFLRLHYKTMPRTTLRYAIERFDPKLRVMYLTDKV